MPTSRAKKAGIGFIGVTGAAVVCLLCVLTFLPTMDWTRTTINDAVSSSVAGDLAIGAIDGSIWDQLVIRDVALSTPTGEQVLRIDEARVAPTLSTLMGLGVTASVDTSGVVVFVRRTTDGELSLTKALAATSPSDEPSELPVWLDLDLRIADCDIIWRDDTASAEADPLAALDAALDAAQLDTLIGSVVAVRQRPAGLPHTAVLSDVETSLRLVVARDASVSIALDETSMFVTAGGVTDRRALRLDAARLFVGDEVRLAIPEVVLADWAAVRGLVFNMGLSAAQPLNARVDGVELRRSVTSIFAPEAGLHTDWLVSAAVVGDASNTTVDATLTPVGHAPIEVFGTVADLDRDVKYDLALIMPSLPLSEVTAVAFPVHKGAATVEVRGSGIDPEALDATIRVRAQSVEIDRYRVSAAFADAQVAAGKLTINEALLETPYAHASLRGTAQQDGTFDITAAVEAADEVEKVATIVFGRKVDTRADVAVHAQGALDLAAEGVDVLRTIEAQANWDVGDFLAEDIRVDASKGDARIALQRTDSRITFDIDADATARGVSAGAARVADVSAKARARASATDNAASPVLSILRSLHSDIEVRVGGLRASGARTERGSIVLQTRPKSGELGVRLDTSVVRGTVADARIGRVGSSLQGAVTIGDVTEWPGIVRNARIAGNVEANDITRGDEAVGGISSTVDVRGPPSNLSGIVTLATSDLRVGGYEFAKLDGRVEFVGDRRFVVEAAGTQEERSPVTVYMRGRTNHDLTDYRILELRISGSEGGDGWALSDGFGVDTKSSTFTFDEVTLKRGDQSVRVTGRFRQGVDQDLKTEIEDLDVATVVDDLGLEELQPLRGTVSGSANLAGTADEPTAEFDVTISDLYWEELGPFRVRLAGRYAVAKLELDAIEVDGYELRLAQGNALLPVRVNMAGDFAVLNDQPLRAQIETPDLGISGLAPMVPAIGTYAVAGTLSMTTRVRGTLLAPTLHSQIRASEVMASDSPGGSAVLGPLELTTTINFTDPKKSAGGFDVAFTAARADDRPLRFLARVQADVAAWIRETLDGQSVDWTRRLAESRWALVAKATKFDLKKLRVGPLRRADVDGQLTLDIWADGTLIEPQARFEIALDNFGWNRYRDVFFSAKVNVDPQKMTLERARLEWDGDEILVARGAAPATFGVILGDEAVDDLPIRAELALRPLPLAKLSAIDYSLASLKGNVRGLIEVGGTPTNPTARAQLTLQEMAFADRSTGNVSFSASYQRETGVAVRLARADSNDKPLLAAEASAPLDINLLRLAAGEPLVVPPSFDAHVEAKDIALAALLPRKILDRWVSEVEGRFTADFRASGPTDQPVFEGRVRLSDAAFTITPISRRFTEAQFDLSAEPGGAMALHDLYVGSERGYISGAGDVAMKGWQPGVVDGDLEIHEFGTTGFSDLPLFLWAKIRMDGDFSTTPASARAVVSDVQVVVPNTNDRNAHPTGLDADIVVIRTESDRKKLLVEGADEEPVSLVPWIEMAVEVESGARVRHPLAEVELSGEVDLALTSAGPVLRGDIEASQGTAQFLGKRFAIQQSIVTFTGTVPPDPRLQIEAHYKLDRSITRSIGQATSGEPRAIARITGRASDPRIRFLSDPSMPEADVITVLLTNRPPSEGEVGETGLASGAASGLLTGLIADSPVGRVFDVKLEAGEQGFTDATIGVGRHIGPDVFVSVDFISGAQPEENNQELNIEYRFLPRWIFEFKAGNRATGEANIFWDLY